jgi:phenylacetate-CoA ligase
VNAAIIARVLWMRRSLRRRERWSRQDLEAHQQHALSELRAFALARSPFYQRFHRGLETAPLSELPVLTKQTLMTSFDEVVTDRALRLGDLQRYLDTLHGDELHAGRYWVSTTSGSSGMKSVIPSDVAEWSAIIASYARANEWAGIRSGLVRRVSMAVVSSTTPWHQSSRVAATLRSPWIVSHRLDAGAPLGETVERLNALQPQALIAYASMIRILAEEQLRGRLRIAPRAVNCSSEVFTAEARALATRAWGRAPFEVYAATETGGIAAECDQHAGLHLFEDLVIPESVDADNRPVPDGVTGDKLLVTVLSSRTLPLIRYEMTDRVRISTRTCACGRPFRLVDGIEGRTDDVLHLPSPTNGLVAVHPVVFHHALDTLGIDGWQVREEEHGLRVLIARPSGALDATAVQQRLRAALAEAGVAPLPIDVSVVEEIPTGAAGKRPLVVSRARAASRVEKLPDRRQPASG